MTLVNNNTAGVAKLTVSGFVNGAGSNNLVLTNNGPVAGGITVTGTLSTTGDLTLKNNGAASGGVTISGVIKNTGDLILKNNGTASSGITISGAVNTTGAVINSGTGTTIPAIIGTTVLSLDKNVLISGIIGSNVTTVTQDSPTSSMELSVANLFTGSARVYSGSLILGLAGAASTSQILVGNTSGLAADASLLVRGLTLTNNILVQAGNSGSATIGSAGATNGGASTYTGQLTLDKSAILSSWNSNVFFSGLVTGAGGITVTQAMGGAFSTSGQSYGISGGTVVLSKADLANTFSGDTAVRAGTLQLTGNATASASLNGLLGSSSNTILLGDNSGYQSARLILSPGAANQTLSRKFAIQPGSGGLVGVGQISSANATLSGSILLNESGYLYGGVSGTPIMTFSGAVTNGGSAIDASSITTSGGGVVNLNNTGNNYNGGSVVGGIGTLWGSGAGALGTGNVAAEAGVVRLSDQVALASGRGIHSAQYGGVSIGANTAAQIAYVAGALDSTSSGSVALGIAIGFPINLASFGNGSMYLGADQGGSESYSAASLGANSDGNYRLGAGSLLTITNGVLVGGTAKVIIGSPANTSPGTGLLNTVGSVTLTGANTYGGGTDVNNAATLRGKQQASSGSPFGSGAMALHNSTLILENATNSGACGSTVGTTVGPLTIEGSSTIQIQGITSLGGTNTLTVGDITRNGKGVVSVSALTVGTLGTNAFFKTTGNAPATTPALASGSTPVALAPVYFLDSVNGNFLSYNATSGFSQIANPYTTIAAAVTNGSNGIVKLTAAETFATTANRSVAALSLSPSAANFSLLNTAGSDVTLTITSGGLNYTNGNLSVVIGATTAGQRINLDFNNKEAVINSTGGGNAALTINGGIVNATGITKSGNGPLILSGTTNTFVGDITVLGGYLQIGGGTDLALGASGASLSNGVVLNGGKLWNDGTLTLSSARTITLGTYGGTLSNKNSGNLSAITTTVDSKIRGAGNYLDVQAGATSGNANNVNSVFVFTNPANDFVAPIFVGTAAGGSNSGRMVLSYDNDSQLGNSANSVTLIGGNSVLRYTGAGATTTARGINFMEQGGSLEVSNAASILTASGTITGSGLFNKLGNGQLNLTGSNAYTANTIVVAGKLNVSNADALGATTAAISGNSGVSGGAVYVQSGAALEVQGGITISGTGGKTLYINGTGVSNGGSLRNVSGDNSNAGRVILQSDSTIAVDAGSLVLSGGITGSGALTKVGTGTLAIGGVSTFTGATTISAGKVIVRGALNGTTGVSVANNATLQADVGAGTMNVGSLSLDSGAHLALAISGTASGQFSNFSSSGAVTLLGATLDLAVSYTPQFADKIYLMIGGYSGATGTFGNSTAVNDANFGLIDQITASNGSLWAIAYGANHLTGNLTGGSDIALYAVPEPSAWALFVGGVGLIGAARRLRRRT